MRDEAGGSRLCLRVRRRVFSRIKRICRREARDGKMYREEGKDSVVSLRQIFGTIKLPVNKGDLPAQAQQNFPAESSQNIDYQRAADVSAHQHLTLAEARHLDGA